MQRAIFFVVSSALIGFTACNKSSQEKVSEKSSEVRQDADKAAANIKEDAQKAADKVQEGARNAAADIKKEAASAEKDIKSDANKAGAAMNNTASDTRETAKNTGNGATAQATNANTKIHESLGMDQAKTDSDKKLNERIRAALKKSKVAMKDADDVSLDTQKGHVTLKGTVTSEEAKKEIASVVRKTAGLTHVSDDVKVAERVGQGSND